MLKQFSFEEIQNKLNLHNFGTESTGAYASYTIENNKNFEDVPGKGWFGTGLCSIGLHAANNDFHIGPSLGREGARYEKRDIDNKAEQLKAQKPYKDHIKQIDKVKEKCISLANEDIENISHAWELPTAVGVITPAIYWATGGEFYSLKMLASFIPSVLLGAGTAVMEGTDAGERFAAFKEQWEGCRNDKSCLDKAYEDGMERCSINSLPQEINAGELHQNLRGEEYYHGEV